MALGGQILNDYLSQTHAADGTLKPGTVSAASLAQDAVTNVAIASNAITTNELAATGGANGDILVKDTTATGGMKWQAAAAASSTVTLAGDVTGLSNANTIAAGAVTAAKLATAAVTSPKLATTGTPTSGQVLSYNGSQLAWTTPAIAAAPVDATSSTKGIVKLAGDLAGTADAPTVPGLATKLSSSLLGQVNGVATLDSTGKVPSSQLPTPTGTTQVNADWNASTGVAQILNKPTVATTLTGLTDVNVGTPTDGQVLTYSTSTSKWSPTTVSGATAAMNGGEWIIKDYTTGSYPTVSTTYYPNPGELIYFLGSPSANVSIVLPATASDGDRIAALRHTKTDADKYGFPDIKKSDNTMLLRRLAPYELVVFEWRSGDWRQATTGSMMDPAPSTAAQDTTPILAVRGIQPRPQAPIHKPDNKIHKWTSVHTEWTLSMSGDTTSGTTLCGSTAYGYAFNSGTTQLTSAATGTRSNFATIPLASAIDLTGRALYIIMSLSTSGTGSLGGFSISVSNSCDFTNSSILTLDHAKLLGGQYQYTGGNQWTKTGAGADLTNVTHVRIWWSITSLTSDVYIAGIGSYKPFSKSAVVLCLDGVPSMKFDANKEFPVWATKGVKGVVFPGIVNELPTRMQRRLTDQGWEFGIRSLLNSSKGGLEAEGFDLVRETQEFVDSCAKAGIARPVVAGQWTNVGSMNANAVNMEVMRQYVSGFRRYYTSIPNQRVLWPPVEPMNIASYGLATIADAKTMIDDAIANPGTMVVFTFHAGISYINEVIDYVKPYFDDGTLLNLTFSEALITGPRELLAVPITGSRSDGTAMQNLLSNLAMMGIIKDNTTP